MRRKDVKAAKTGDESHGGNEHLHRLYNVVRAVYTFAFRMGQVVLRRERGPTARCRPRKIRDTTASRIGIEGLLGRASIQYNLANKRNGRVLAAGLGDNSCRDLGAV